MRCCSWELKLGLLMWSAIFGLALVALAACVLDSDPLDPSRNTGAAGSVAVNAQAATTKSYKVINSNFGADIAAEVELNLIRVWVTQFTNPTHYQPAEWTCSVPSVGKFVCASNINTSSWTFDQCVADPVQPSSTRCRIGGGGWATMVRCTNTLCGTTVGWYAQFFNGNSANATGMFPSSHPVLTVRTP